MERPHARNLGASEKKKKREREGESRTIGGRDRDATKKGGAEEGQPKKKGRKMQAWRVCSPTKYGRTS
jgi:hypothetical protein